MLFVSMVTAEINAAQPPSLSPSIPLSQVTSEGLICNLLNTGHPCVCVCCALLWVSLKAASIIARTQASTSDTGTEREHRVWNNLVYLLLTQDYLLDNRVKEDRERGGEKRDRGLKDERKRLRIQDDISWWKERRRTEKVKRNKARKGATSHKEEYLAQNVELSYVDEKKDAIRIYVSQFPPNCHLSLFHTLTQTYNVIPRVGTDTHCLRGGIGLVNLPIISSHRCN